MLFAGSGSVRIVKNCDRGLVLKMLPKAAGLGQHFQVRGHSFSLYGPTLSRQITYLFFPLSQTKKKNSRKKLTQALL